jgi:hypothetical protein
MDGDGPSAWRRTVLVACAWSIELKSPSSWPYNYMKDSPAVANEEPMGIVISGGISREQRPLFIAYEWSPAPDEPAARQDVKAA